MLGSLRPLYQPKRKRTVNRYTYEDIVKIAVTVYILRADGRPSKAIKEELATMGYEISGPTQWTSILSVSKELGNFLAEQNLDLYQRA